MVPLTPLDVDTRLAVGADWTPVAVMSRVSELMLILFGSRAVTASSGFKRRFCARDADFAWYPAVQEPFAAP
ncbi:hypothetical protein RB213_010011 [Colletotrichum asianum]